MNREELKKFLGLNVSFVRPNYTEIEGKVIAVDFSRNSVDIEAIGEYWRNVPVGIIKIVNKND